MRRGIVEEELTPLAILGESNTYEGGRQERKAEYKGGPLSSPLSEPGKIKLFEFPLV